MTGPAAPAAAPRTSRGLGLVVALVTVAVFLRGLGGEFLNWDDAASFVENPHYRGLGPAQLRWMFTTFHMGLYMPFTWITLGLDYLLWGMNPWGYHATSLALHGATTFAFYAVALRLLRLAMPGTAEPDLRLGAAAAALLWSLHPLRVESVAWITERRDVLSGFFYLAAILAYLRSTGAEDAGRHRWYWGALGLFTGALLSKSITVTLPVVLLVLDVYPLRRLGGERGWRDRRVWLEKLPFFALACAAAVLAFTANSSLSNRPSWSDMGPGVRLVLSIYGFVFYLQKTLLPLGLSPLYPLDVHVTWLHFAAVLVWAALALALRRRWPAFTAVSLVYAVTLLPVSGLFQNGMQAAADRYSYLACLGWALLGGAAVARRWTGTRVVRVVAALWLAALAALAWQQTGVWRDSVTLWRHALTVNSLSRAAHFNLGGAYEGQGRFAEAVAEYYAVLRLSGNQEYWHITIGWAWEKAGMDRRALEAFREALRLHPGLPDACAGVKRVSERMKVSPEGLSGCPPGG
ncbi:MAG TPA: tetratricopeptide repeat protein [Methylomirabilota bacterium]|nr:tetratricopeptide repeat protein [Methylomirabilota bacterium]